MGRRDPESVQLMPIPFPAMHWQSQSSLVTGLVGYWKLDEASGNRLDSIGSNHLTPTAAPGNAAGKVGNATQFTAASVQRLAATDASALRSGAFDMTLSAWIYLDSLGAAREVMMKSSSIDEYGIEISTSNRAQLYVYNGTTYFTVIASTFGALSASTWYYISAWYDYTAKTINISVNNGTADSLTTGTSNPAPNTGSFYVGAYRGSGGAFMNGRIDEVKKWNRLLTPTERTLDYTNGLAGIPLL